MDEKLISYALEIMRKREESYSDLMIRAADQGRADASKFWAGMSSGYEGAIAILQLAMTGNLDCLRQYDYNN